MTLCLGMYGLFDHYSRIGLLAGLQHQNDHQNPNYNQLQHLVYFLKNSIIQNQNPYLLELALALEGNLQSEHCRYQLGLGLGGLEGLEGLYCNHFQR